MASNGERRNMKYRSSLLILGLMVFFTNAVALACNDYFVCAPTDPWRHTVDEAQFTNIYLYPNPETQSWNQYTAKTLAQPAGSPAMTTQNIDGAVNSLVGDSNYFYAATQYHKINIPSFLGHQRTYALCMAKVMDYARTHNNVLSREVIADFVGCQNGGEMPSNQVNVILSPEFTATIDVHTTINIPPFDPIQINIMTQPAACPPNSNTVAFHTWQFGTANFTVIPTMCNSSLDNLVQSISHEMVELISDPAGLGYVYVPGGGDQIASLPFNNKFLNTGELGDICEKGGIANASSDPNIAFVKMPHSNVRASRYWSNADRSCQPAIMVGGQDLLVNDTHARRLGSGGGMQSNLDYKAPFLHGKPDQLIRQLMFYSKTTDDNLCHQSSLDVKLFLTGGRPPIVFNHINNVQYAGSWDNNEDHGLNLNVKPGLRIKDIDHINVHIQSGHCNNLPTDGDDAWNVNRIAIYASLSSDLGTTPVLSMDNPVPSIFSPSLMPQSLVVKPGNAIPILAKGFSLGYNDLVTLTWNETASPDVIKTIIRGAPGGQISIDRQAGDGLKSYLVTGIPANTQSSFQIANCASDGCTPYSNIVKYKTAAALPLKGELYLTQGSTRVDIGPANISSGSFNLNPIIPFNTTPGTYRIVLNRNNYDEATSPPFQVVTGAAADSPQLYIVVDAKSGLLTQDGGVTIGGTLAVRGMKFLPFGIVEIHLDSPTGQMLVNGIVVQNGQFDLSFKFPVLGRHKIFAVEQMGSTQNQAFATVTSGPIIH